MPPTSPRERHLLLATFLASIPGWFLLLPTFACLISGLVGFWALLGLGRAWLAAFAQRVGPTQQASLWEHHSRAARALALPAPPPLYLVQSPLRLATTLRLFGEPLTLLSDTAVLGLTPDELDFLLGRTLGPLATGHLGRKLALLPALVFPWIGPAWWRARVYTADLAGLAVLQGGTPEGDRGRAAHALLRLSLGPGADLEAQIEQRRLKRGFWGTLRAFASLRPDPVDRALALLDREESIPQNPLGIVLSPLLSPQVVSVGLLGWALFSTLATAIPTYFEVRERTRLAEITDNLDRLRAAENAWFGAHGEYLACGSQAEARRDVARGPHPLSETLSASCFERLGFSPPGELRGGYWVEVNLGERPDFAARAILDLDRDGDYATAYASAAEGARRVSAEGVR